MTKSEAFLTQARSDFKAYTQLPRLGLPQCHQLHYLQMASEKLAKAVALRGSPDFDEYTHFAIEKELRQALARSAEIVAPKLGYRDVGKFRKFLKQAHDLFVEIEKLCPQVADKKGGPRGTNPNAEYPWEAPGADGTKGWIAPAEYDYPQLAKLNESYWGIRLPVLIRLLLDRFDEVFSNRTATG